MTKLTLPWTRQGRFLRALAKTGNVAGACRAAGIDRRLAYRWRARAPGFARRWKEVLSQATDLLRGENGVLKNTDQDFVIQVRVSGVEAKYGVGPAQIVMAWALS